MAWYSYVCSNKDCKNSIGFEIERNINDKTEECPLCNSKVNRIYQMPNVNLNFNGSFNNSRNGDK